MITQTTTYNPETQELSCSQQSSENSFSGGVDFCSNGIKIRSTFDEINNNNNPYHWIAFAEHPFGGSNVSPAPAR